MNTFQDGERVIIIDGPFLGMEGQVRMDAIGKAFMDAEGMVLVIVKVFGRDLPVGLEYGQVKRV